MVGSTVLSAVICWFNNHRVSGSKKRSKQIKKAGSVPGTSLEILELTVQRKVLHKLLSIMDNSAHPQHQPQMKQSDISQRLVDCVWLVFSKHIFLTELQKKNKPKKKKKSRKKRSFCSKGLYVKQMTACSWTVNLSFILFYLSRQNTSTIYQYCQRQLHLTNKSLVCRNPQKNCGKFYNQLWTTFFEEICNFVNLCSLKSKVRHIVQWLECFFCVWDFVWGELIYYTKNIEGIIFLSTQISVRIHNMCSILGHIFNPDALEMNLNDAIRA